MFFRRPQNFYQQLKLFPLSRKILRSYLLCSFRKDNEDINQKGKKDDYIEM